MTTEHPLTETAAAVLWDAHRSPNALPFHEQGDLYMRDQTAMIRAAFDAGREHERARALPAEVTDEMVEAAAKVLALASEGSSLRYLEDIERHTFRARARNVLSAALAVTTPPAEEVDLPTEFGDVILNPRWGARSYARAVHLGEGVWAAEVTPGADVYTHLAHDLAAFTLPDGTRARRDGKHDDGTPRFIQAQEGEK